MPDQIPPSPYDGTVRAVPDTTEEQPNRTATRKPMLHVVTSGSEAAAANWVRHEEMFTSDYTSIRIYTDADSMRGINFAPGDRVIMLHADADQREQARICDRRADMDRVADFS